MTELERLELILRRVIARRLRDHREKNAVLNIDVQDLLNELADEIHLASVERRS